MLRRHGPLTRKARRPWRRPDEDKVTPALREQILDRDRVCFASRVDLSHQCRDRWGMPHRADDRGRLTLDHVHDASTMGKRAKSDASHLVAMCGSANNNGWASAHREAERAYLREVNDGPDPAV